MILTGNGAFIVQIFKSKLDHFTEDKREKMMIILKENEKVKLPKKKNGVLH